MARTKLSRGKEPFKMKSPETPYPFLGKIVGGAVGAIKNVLPGGGGNNNSGGNADDVNTKIDEIHKALVGNNEMGGGVGEGRTLASVAKDAALTKNKKY